MSQKNQIAINVDAIINDPSFQSNLKNVMANPSELKTLLDTTKANVLNQVEKQKKGTFDRVYGKLGDTTQKNAVLMTLDGRSKQLDSIQKKITNVQSVSSQNIAQDKDLAQRTFETNEWSVQNKKETLFIYSLFFMLITGIVLLSALLNLGMISSYLFTGLIVPFVIIFIFIVIYRARVTSIYRNKRYWNRRDFQDEESRKLRVPKLSLSVCNPPDQETTA
jgi:predicted RND superfamily exporter protein